MSFLPSVPVILSYSLASVILTITPGPDMTLFLSRTLAGGRRLGFAAMLGATTGLIVHALLASLGLSALLAASATAFTVLKIAGALYLLWLAWQAVKHGSALNVSGAPGKNAGLVRTWLTGIGINLTNPKVVIFYVTFLPQFVDIGDPDASSKMLFLGLFFQVIALPLSISMILAADRFIGALRRRPRLMRAFDWTFAGVMSAFALRLLVVQGR